ncbi:hypothetical protein [Acetobacterium bakii]|uniref:Uncharacterized protein n=1 Tax=Acetobacterium bakii TaxID=52689 RepID=A0A0L6TW30_9FIRM|nr:hypothetical protein [Acetobacterium bakii]KNZ40471.1 hypothetical protein AKG39_17550 [Acetobacterium bakii]
MENIKDFDILICGEPTSDMYVFEDVLTNLSSKIAKLTKLTIEYDWNSNRANIEIPFYGRNVLESTLTALLGRTDPFRLITVYKTQADASYDLGKKAQLAVEWTGDIIAKKMATDLWSCEKKKDSYDRALLGNHMGELVWKPAFRELSDFLEVKEYESDWLNEVLSEDENSNFEKSKSIAVRLFSSFSKGVHSECLVDINTMLDTVTLKSLIKDMYKLCATLGLLSHFIGYIMPIVERDRALTMFLDVEEMINNV